MLQNVVRGLCRNSGGVILVAGAIGVLAGVQRLMSARTPVSRTSRISQSRSPVPAAAIDRFSIRRTKSEIGYCFWVLQGYGKYKGFDLFDTWQEAIHEAQRRIDVPEHVAESVLALAAGV